MRQLNPVGHLYESGTDLAHSIELRLDHGSTLPLQQLKIAADVRIVLVIINALFRLCQRWRGAGGSAP